jgi:methylated-DNA-protein-cysteine methyltransferase-like protein
MSDRSSPQSFADRVKYVVERIPAGRLATYGQVALYAGNREAARAVGNILRGLGTNAQLPWHRVINAKGRISIKGDTERAKRQKQRLESEGLDAEDYELDLQQYRWSPDRLFWADAR